MRPFSRMDDGLILLIEFVYLPCCAMINIYREYKAVITIVIPIRIMVTFDHEKDDTTTNSSPISLIVGGRARFVRLASSHHCCY